MIEHLLKRREGENWVPVSAHASTKKFYKGNYEGSDALLIYFEQGEEERKRFVFLTKLLEKKEIPVPRILFDGDEDEPYVITEFIDGSLLSKHPLERFFLNKTVQSVIKFPKINDEEIKPINPLTLDFEKLKYEMDFFLLHFCGSFLNDDRGEEVKWLLYELCEEIDNFSKVFSHRDYHSENIIVRGEEIFIVDYQDSLYAPRCYDLASLYVDGYCDYEKSFREDLIVVASENFNASTKEFKMTAIQRALKALGTFGYQITYRKRIKYLSSVHRTLAYLESLCEDEEKNLKNFIHYLSEKV